MFLPLILEGINNKLDIMGRTHVVDPGNPGLNRPQLTYFLALQFSMTHFALEYQFLYL